MNEWRLDRLEPLPVGRYSRPITAADLHALLRPYRLERWEKMGWALIGALALITGLAWQTVTRATDVRRWSER